MKKINNIIVILIFAAFILVFAIGSLILPDKSFSAAENRELQQKPEFTWTAVLSGDYEEELLNYTSDQIIGRNFWVSARTGAKLAMGSRDVNGVYFCSGGRLVEKITQADIDSEIYKKNLAAVKTFFDRLDPSVGRSLIIVPAAETMLSNQLPEDAATFDWTALEKQALETVGKSSYVSLTAAFSKEKKSGLYYLTDHHWNSEGTQAAFKQWMMSQKTHGLPKVTFQEKKLADGFYGSLWSKVIWGKKSDTVSTFVPAGSSMDGFTFKADGKEMGSIYQMKYASEKDKYAAFFGGNYGRVEITGGPKNGRTLLIVKDSYANSFAPLAAAEYEKVCMVDLRYFSGSLQTYMDDNKVTDVLVLYSIKNMTQDRGIAAIASAGTILH